MSSARQAHVPKSPHQPEQQFGQLSPQLQDVPHELPLPVQEPPQSPGWEQTPAPPGVPGEDAQHTRPSLHGWSVPVAQPHPMYEQLKPARAFIGSDATMREAAAIAAARSVPRRDLRAARARVAASNR